MISLANITVSLGVIVFLSFLNAIVSVKADHLKITELFDNVALES